MLTALAEEVHNMDKSRRQEIVTATGQQWNDIAALAQGFIPEHMAAGTRLQWTCMIHLGSASRLPCNRAQHSHFAVRAAADGILLLGCSGLKPCIVVLLSVVL
jgi:hypothetical protein